MLRSISGDNIFCTILVRSWRLILGVLVPIFLSPLLFDLDQKEKLCAYVLFLMVFYWVFEPINLYITALIPVALFPLLNITTTEEICQNYMKAANMMFVGGLIIGISLEHCNLHHRIALKVVILFGSSMKLLMAGVMCVTMFLSMWINNTATTAMMIPIVDDILNEINVLQERKKNKVTNDKQMSAITIGQQQEIQVESTSGSSQQKQPKLMSEDNSNNNDDNNQNDVVDEPKPQVFQMKTLRKAFLLSIAYSANIGGTATLTGTGTNLVFQDVFFSQFPDSTEISFTSWFFYAFPSALLTVLAAWLLLYLLYARIPNEPKETGELIKASALKKYLALGPMTFHEIGVLIHFLILILLWFSRQPEIVPGWANLISDNPHNIKDATPAILITIFMFLVPANLHQFYSKNRPKKIERLLNWNVVQTNMSWGVIILLGGGFALAFGAEKSKLTVWFSEQLEHVDLNPFPTMIALVFLSAAITEMASNVATANVILPVISHLAVQMGINPLMLMIPVTISISFAFMFPVSTPPNAIVFGYLKINLIEMIKPGIIMNIIAIVIQLISINTLGRLLFDLNNFPDWALDNNDNLTMTTTTASSTSIKSSF